MKLGDFEHLGIYCRSCMLEYMLVEFVYAVASYLAMTVMVVYVVYSDCMCRVGQGSSSNFPTSKYFK